MITHDNTGGRVVQLFVPFEFGGKRVDSITLSAFKFGHVLRWNEGYFKNMMGLLVNMAGVEENVLRELRYPDADRVMEAFMAMLTPEVRNDILSGQTPVAAADAVTERRIEDLDEEPASTNGSGSPVMPGVPLPPFDSQPGFDLSEEP